VDGRKQQHGRRGRFIGSWGRLNCESIPVIPAWLVRSNLDDPQIRRVEEGEWKHHDRTHHLADAAPQWRAVLFMLCPCCEMPRRFVYGWAWDSVSG
jgi:hypothetical protein